MDLRTRVAALVLCTLCTAPALPQAAPASSEPDLETLYDALRAPSVLGSVPAPPKITIGRAEIRPAAGTRLMVMGAAGEPCGWFFDGPGALVYRVEDRFSVPLARRNLKEAHRIDVTEAGGALIVSTGLEGAALWGWDLDLGEITPAGGPELVPPKWLREILDEKLSNNPERDMLLARLNGGPEYRWALFHAAGDDFFLDDDARPLVRTESLYRFNRVDPGSPYSGRIWSQELAAQPIDRTWLETNGWEVEAIRTEIDLRAEKKDHLAVSTSTDLRLLRDGLRVVAMYLWDEVFDDKFRAHEYRISRLKLNGKPAPYVHRNDLLLVRLPEPSRRGATVRLELDVAGDVLERPSGDNYWRLVAGWYPSPMLSGRERAEFAISMDVPAPFIPFAPGEVLERTGSEGRNRVRTKLEGPMEYAMVLAGKYRTVTEEHEGDRVHVSSYAFVKEEEARRLARIVLAIRSCLERWLGVPYPFKDLEVIEINQWGWGQAPPGIIFITQEAFLTRARASIDEETEFIAGFVSRGINERVAHEVAHAWFPHVAKISFSEENWLSESLADYTSAYCLAESMEGRQKKYHWNRQLDQWKYWSKLAGDDASVLLSNHLASTEQDFRDRYYLLYGRGPLVLQAVREKLEKQHGKKEGLALFLTWIRSYVKNFTFKTAETRHLIGILNQMTGEDWQPFFDRHLIGTEPPNVQ